MRTEFIAILLLATPVCLEAKEPPENPLFWDFNLYGAYGFDKTSAKLSNYMLNEGEDDLWGNYFDFSAGLMLHGSGNFGFGFDAGYKQEHFHYSGYDLNAGLYLKSVPVRLSVKLFKAIYFGVRSDIMLNYDVIDAKNFSYVGLKNGCVNKMTLVPYFGFNFPIFPDFFFSFKINCSVISVFNYEKISYYNMCDNTWNPALSFEFGISYRIFTSGRRNDSEWIFFHK